MSFSELSVKVKSIPGVGAALSPSFLPRRRCCQKIAFVRSPLSRPSYLKNFFWRLPIRKVSRRLRANDIVCTSKHWQCWTLLLPKLISSIQVGHKRYKRIGWKTWSSGYGRWLMFERSWFRILNPGWSWHWFVVKIVCLKRLKINKNRLAHFF